MPNARFIAQIAALAGVLALGACGGGGDGPAGPTGPPATTPPTTVPPGNTVAALVFYDENGGGTLDASETIRIPDVTVSVAGRTGKTQKGTGRATIQGVANGTHPVTIDAGTLPPFYRAGAAMTVTAPQAEGAVVHVPVLLPIGRDLTPNVYMAFGDSITRGDGATPGGDYPTQLHAELSAHFGGAVVNNRGADGTNSFEGIERIKRNLRGSDPAYTLILYGTNDWHDPRCQDNPGPPCFTVENLRSVVNTVQDVGGLVVVGTIPPVNPSLAPSSRNDWARSLNGLVRTMAAEEGAVVAEVFAAFERNGNLSSLFVDHVHPNDAGYALIAEAFFEAIAHGRGSASSPRFGFSRP